MRRAAARPRTAASAGPIRQPPQAHPAPARWSRSPCRPSDSARNRSGRELPRRSIAISTPGVQRSINQLGSEVTQAIREIDQRLHEVFDHHVSSLEFKPGKAATEPMAVGPAELSHQPEPSPLPFRRQPA